MSKKIRKGDRVIVTAGNDKGKTGEVLSRTEERVLVQGVNVRKKHMRRTQQTQGGRVVEIEIPIHIWRLPTKSIFVPGLMISNMRISPHLNTDGLSASVLAAPEISIK